MKLLKSLVTLLTSLELQCLGQPKIASLRMSSSGPVHSGDYSESYKESMKQTAPYMINDKIIEMFDKRWK